MKRISKRLILASVLILALILCIALFSIGAMQMVHAPRISDEFSQSHTFDQSKDEPSAAQNRQRPLADPMTNLMQMLHGMLGVEPPPQLPH